MPELEAMIAVLMIMFIAAAVGVMILFMALLILLIVDLIKDWRYGGEADE